MLLDLHKVLKPQLFEAHQDITHELTAYSARALCFLSKGMIVAGPMHLRPLVHTDKAITCYEISEVGIMFNESAIIEAPLSREWVRHTANTRTEVLTLEPKELLEIVRNGDPDTAHQWVSEGPGGYWRQGWSW